MHAYPADLFARQFERFNQARAADVLVPLMSCVVPNHPPPTAIFSTINWCMDSHFIELVWLFTSWEQRFKDVRIWLAILDDTQNEDERWQTQLQFVDPVLHYCLLQPSSHCDRLIRLASQLLHHANLHVRRGFDDWLEEDDLPKGRHLTNPQRIKQLKRLAENWIASPSLLDSIASINGKDYKRATADYRNSASHFIPPRFGIGYTRSVKREVYRVGDLCAIEREFCGLQNEPLDTKKIRYAMYEHPPLNLGDLLVACETELKNVASAFGCLDALVEEIQNTCQIRLPRISAASG